MGIEGVWEESVDEVKGGREFGREGKGVEGFGFVRVGLGGWGVGIEEEEVEFGEWGKVGVWNVLE